MPMKHLVLLLIVVLGMASCGSKSGSRIKAQEQQVEESNEDKIEIWKVNTIPDNNIIFVQNTQRYPISSGDTIIIMSIDGEPWYISNYLVETTNGDLQLIEHSDSTVSTIQSYKAVFKTRKFIRG